MPAEELLRIKETQSLERTLEEAEVIQTGMKIILIDPSLDSKRKDEYEKAFVRLRNEIRELMVLVENMRTKAHSAETRQLVRLGKASSC